MAKFKDLSSGNILKVTDKARIEKLKGYPDKFELLEESKGTPVKKEEKNENKKIDK